MAGGYHYYDVGHLVPIGGADVGLSSTDPRWKPGQQGYFQDQLGARYAKYCKNVSTAAYAQGELVSKAGDLNGQTTPSSVVLGSTTHMTTTGLTANFHEGALVYVLNKSATAGAAPEGEIALAKRNTATRVDFNKTYPLSVALAVSDTVSFMSTYCSEKAASADNAVGVLGVVLPLAVADGEYFWAQQKGRCRVVTVNTIAPTVGLQAMVSATAGAATVVVLATTIYRLKIGHFFMAIGANDLVNDYGWIDIRVDEYTESNSVNIIGII